MPHGIALDNPQARVSIGKPRTQTPLSSATPMLTSPQSELSPTKSSVPGTPGIAARPREENGEVHGWQPMQLNFVPSMRPLTNEQACTHGRILIADGTATAKLPIPRATRPETIPTHMRPTFKPPNFVDVFITPPHETRDLFFRIILVFGLQRLRGKGGSRKFHSSLSLSL